MKTCDFCGKETDDYKIISELDNQVMCQECLEQEADFYWQNNDTPYDYGYDGEG